MQELVPVVRGEWQTRASLGADRVPGAGDADIKSEATIADIRALYGDLNKDETDDQGKTIVDPSVVGSPY